MQHAFSLLPLPVQQVPFQVPQLLREVDIIIMRILEALHLIPQQIDLLGAPGPHLSDGRGVVHPLALLEDGHQQLLGGEVGEHTALPGGVRVEATRVACAKAGIPLL